MRYAVMDGATVSNVILVDEGSDFPLDGLIELGDEPVSIGWTRVEGEWVASESEPAEEVEGPTPDQLRHAAYIEPGGPDSIFMKWQREKHLENGTTEQDWLDAVQAVKDQFPDPEE